LRIRAPPAYETCVARSSDVQTAFFRDLRPSAISALEEIRRMVRRAQSVQRAALSETLDPAHHSKARNGERSRDSGGDGDEISAPPMADGIRQRDDARNGNAGSGASATSQPGSVSWLTSANPSTLNSVVVVANNVYMELKAWASSARSSSYVLSKSSRVARSRTSVAPRLFAGRPSCPRLVLRVARCCSVG
jgi:hypothetical protein